MELVPFLCLLIGLGASLEHEDEPAVITEVVQEGGDIILPCSLSTKENIQQKVFDWKKDDVKDVFLYDSGHHYNNGRTGQDEQFNGRISHFEDQLKNGNASIIIRNTKVADSGMYTCLFVIDHQPQKRSIIHLLVNHTLKDRSAENIHGASPKPVTNILDATEDGVPLKCEVEGAFPEPEVEWQDSEGNLLPAKELNVSETGGRYSVTLLTTVTKTKTNLFWCVIKQQSIHHVTHREIYVPEKMFEECKVSRQVIGLWITTSLAGLFLGVGATVIYFKTKPEKGFVQV